MSMLSIDEEKKTEERANENDVCWKILFVGWDRFCRSTFQQIEVLKLALSYSASEMDTTTTTDRLTSEGADISAQAQKPTRQGKKSRP